MEELKENIVATIIENEELTDTQKVECLKRLNNLRDIKISDNTKENISSFINKQSYWPYIWISKIDEDFNIRLLIDGSEINILVKKDAFSFKYSDILESYQCNYEMPNAYDEIYYEEYTMNRQGYLPKQNDRTISITTKFINEECAYKKLIDGNKITDVIAFLDTNEAFIRVSEEETNKYYYASSAIKILDAENNNYYVEEIKEEHYQKVRKEYENNNGTRN